MKNARVPLIVHKKTSIVLVRRLEVHMRVWKLVSGILSLILFLVVMLQSCAAGVVDAVENEGGTGGAAGLFFGLLLLAAAIVSIATRNSMKKGCDVALIVLFGLAAVIGFAAHGVYSDLIVWSVWATINAVLAFVSISKKNKYTY